MMAPHGTQDHFREARPEVGRYVHFRLACQSLEIDLEPIGEAAAVELPVTEIERASKIQHDALDLGPRPKRFYHLRVGRLVTHVDGLHDR
jgi:hypothetical protein